jgi:3'-phosphoadenosine 5'-phosphosulfate sulfotransferase (PAPS reductase)/FAD synthetase
MPDPFKIQGPTCISFSGGRTSAYMLWRVLESNGGLPGDAKVLFCNTGKEEEATLQFVDRCALEWDVPITWLEYRNPALFAEVTFATASRNGEPFEAVIRQRGGYLPNRVARYCSSELKTRTMHRYLKNIGWEEWDTFIGIRADEPRRVAKFRANPNPETKSEDVFMPLAATNISSKLVGDFWAAQPFDLALSNFNGKTMHGNCDLCYLKPTAQLISLIQEKPSRAIWWARMEKEAESVANTASRFHNDRPSYKEMLAFSKQQTDMFDQNEEAISCFCGD